MKTQSQVSYRVNMADCPTEEASEHGASARWNNGAATAKNGGDTAEQLILIKRGIILRHRVSSGLPTNFILGFALPQESMNKKPVIAFAYNDVTPSDLSNQDLVDADNIPRPD
jgi:hypothetical protein